MKIGRLTVGENFGSFSCNFQNLTFCRSQPGSVSGDYWYNYPVSQWGAQLEFAFDEFVKLELGVFQVNPTYVDDSWAAHNGLLPDNPSGTTGALIPLDVQWTPKFSNLPDSFKFGVWYDTSNANDVYFDVNYQPPVLTGDTPLRRHGRDGAYLSFEQQISGEASKSGAQLFFNITQADRETSPLTDRQIALGVQYKGPFNARPADVIGFAVGTTHVNSRVAAGERLLDEVTGSTMPVQTSEYQAELFYGWTPWPFVTLRPNVQYVLFHATPPPIGCTKIRPRSVPHGRRYVTLLNTKPISPSAATLPSQGTTIPLARADRTMSPRTSRSGAGFDCPFR